MNSKRFEHRIEQVSIPFKTQTSGVLFKSTEVTLEPDLVQLLQHDTFQALLGPQGTRRLGIGERAVYLPRRDKNR